MSSQYYMLITTLGLVEFANASQSSAAQVAITHMAFGDANGATPIPSVGRTALINERARIAVNSVSQNATNPNWIETEAIIPAATSGFTIREVGLYAGTKLVAYGNYPSTFKPLPTDGTSRIMTIKAIIQLDNPAAVQMVIDPSIVLATKKYVDDRITFNNMAGMRPYLTKALLDAYAGSDKTTFIGQVTNDTDSTKNGNYVWNTTTSTWIPTLYDPYKTAMALTFIFLSRQAIPLILSGLRAMAMALITNPLTWIVAAIVAVALVIYKYWGPIKAFFKGFWAGLQEGLAPLRESLSSVFGTIAAALAPLKPIWDGLVAVFGLIGQAIGSLFSPFNATKEQLEGATSAGHTFGKWVGIIIGAPLQMLVNAFVLVGTAIGNAIGFIATLPPKISAAWDGITGYFSGLWEGIKGSFNSGIDSIKSIINSVDAVFADNPILNILLPFIGIPRMIIANWGSITVWFSSLWATVQQAFGKGIELVKSLLLNWTPIGLVYKNWDAITTWFSTKWESIKSAFNTGIEATKSFLLNWTPAGYVYSHWDGISSWFSSKWEATKGAFSSGVEGSQSVLSTWVPAGVYSRWDGISSWFATKWAQIKAFFSSGIGNISKTILDWSPLSLFYQAFAKVLSWFGVDLPAKFSGFGSMIIDGLIGGIEKGFDKLKDVWAKVNSYMPDFMRKRMDIHSPSRVFASIGDHIMQGLGKGIRENESPITGLKETIKSMLAASAISLPMAITANAALPVQQQNISRLFAPLNIPAVANQQQTVTQSLLPATSPPVAGQQQNIVQRLIAAVIPPAGDQQQTIMQRVASAIIPPVANQQQSIIQRLVAAVVPPAGDQQQTIFQRLASVDIPAPTDQQQTISQVLKPAILNLPEVFHSILKLTLDNSFTKNIPTMLMASMGYDTGIIKNPPPVPDVTPIMARMVNSQPVNAGSKTPPSMVVQGDTYNIHLYQQPGQSNEQLAQLVRKEIEKLKQQKQAAIRSSFLDQD